MSLFDDLPAIGAAPRAGLFDDLPDVEKDGPLTRGFKRAINSGRTAYNLTTGDAETGATLAAERADYARKNPGSPEGNELMAAWERGDGVTGGIKEVAGEVAKDWTDAPNVMSAVRATGKNLGAMGGGILEQMPNMVAPMAGMLAGGAAGSLAGPAGTVGGAFAGATAGNTAMEAAEQVDRAIRQAGINPEDKAAVKAYLAANGDTVLGQAATKGAIIGAVDTATMGAGHLLLSAPGKAAAGRALEGMGVDLADRAAVKAAMASDDFAARVASDTAYQASQKGLPPLARNATVAALEPAGEFTGEYLGQGAATGDWDTKGAALEALSSVGQGAVTFAGQKLYEAATSPLRGKDAPPMPGPGDVDQANADLGFAAGQYANLVPSEQPLLGSQPSVIAVPTQDGGTTTIDRNTGPLSDIAVDVVQGQIQTGMPLRAYATTMDAQAALEQRPDGERMRVAPHPRASGRYAVVPKTAEALTAIDRKAEAQMKSEERLATVESEDGNASQVATTGGQGSGTVAGGSAGDSSSLGGVTGGRGGATGTSAPGRGADTSLGDASVGDAALDELAPAPVQPVSSMPAAERVKAERQAAARAEAQARGAQLTDDEVSSANTAPTEAQQAAGNYQKGHVKIGSLDISIENPAGSTRSGKEGRKSWSVQMSDHYGYIKRTEGADGEQVDVYVKTGTATDHNGPVFVVDQYNPKTGQFDEHKAFVGYRTALDVTRSYDAHFSDGTGPKRRKGITKMAPDAFTAWARHGDTSQAADKAQAEIAQSTGKESKKRSNGDLYQAAAEANKRKQERRLPTEQNDTLAVREATGAEVSVVSEKELPEADAAPAGHVSRQTAEFSRHVAKLFGKRVVFVEGMPADGFYNHGNTIYLSTTGSVHHLRLLGHEMLHALRSQSKETYAKLLEAVREVVTDAQLKSQFSDYFSQDKDKKDWTDDQITEWLADDKNRDFLTEEWMADLSGNRWTESAFWEDVFTQVEGKYGSEQAKGIIAKLRLALITALNKLKTLVRGSAFAVDGRVGEQLDQIRAALATGFADYAKAVKDGQVSEGNGETKFSGKETASDHKMLITREERELADKTKLTREELSKVTKYAKQFGLPPKQVETEVRRIKARFPESAGWAPLEFLRVDPKTMAKKATKERPLPADAIFFVEQGYKFHTGDKSTHDQRVKRLGSALAGEITGKYVAAQNGDPVAKVIMRQADWYQALRGKLRSTFGGFGDFLAQLLGPTSANNPVEPNFKYGIEALKMATSGKWDNLFKEVFAWRADIDAAAANLDAVIEKVKAEGGKGVMKDPRVVLAAKELKKASVYKGEHPRRENGKQFGMATKGIEQILAEAWGDKSHGDAPKTKNYYQNIMGRTMEATIDVWAARTLRRLANENVGNFPRIPPVAETAVAGSVLVDNVTSGSEFGFGQEVFREAAEQLRNSGIPQFEKTTPDAVQAMIWFAEKELWARRDWTTKVGEEGSIEHEMLLAGFPDRAQVDAWRVAARAGHPNPDTKAFQGKDGAFRQKAFEKAVARWQEVKQIAAEELAKIERYPDRFVAGVTTEIPNDKPTDSEMSSTARELDAVITGDKVMAKRVIASTGEFMGDFERTLDVEAVVRNGFDANPLWNKLVEIGDREGQQAVFLSRVLREDELGNIDPTKHRPGVELYFAKPRTLAEVQPLMDLINEAGVHGMTMATEGRRTPGALAGKDQPIVGIRMQHIPEFMLGYGYNVSMTNAEISSAVLAARDQMRKLVEQLSARGDVATATAHWYETRVHFYGNTESEGSSRAGSPAVDQRVWSGQRIGEALAGAARFDGDGKAPLAARRAELLAARQVSRRDPAKLSTQRSNAARDERNGGSNARTGEEVRGYGVSQPGSVSVQGIHYSKQERSSLDGRYYGTGARGAEGPRVRTAEDARLKERVYFYVNKETGIRPEDGVGSIAHAAQLNNVYDANADTWVQTKVDRALSGDAWLNAFESAVIDNGFDGYVTDFGTQRAAVLLGRHNVPVTRGQGAVSETKQARRTDLPMGKMTGAEWKKLEPRATELEDDKSYYRDEIRYSPDRFQSIADDFTGRIREAVANPRNTRPVLIHSDTPASMQILGWANRPLLVEASELAKIANKPGFETDEKIGNLVLDLARPGAMFWNEKQGSLNILRREDMQGAPALIAVRAEVASGLAGKGSEPARAHLMVTAHRLENQGALLRKITSGELKPLYLYRANPLIKQAMQKKKYRVVTSRVLAPENRHARFDVKLDMASRLLSEADLVKWEQDKWGDAPKFSPARWYFSPLQRAFEQAPDKMFSTAPQVKAWLSSNASKLGVKQDEIQWSGINDWLDLQGKNKVSKDQVVQYLQQNGVQVEEVEKGKAGFNEDDPQLPEDSPLKVVESDEEYHGDLALRYKYVVIDDEADTTKGWGHTEAEAISDAYSGHPEYWGGAEATEYRQYVLPGGKNYRELLLTLPTKAPLSTRYVVEGQGPGAKLKDTKTGFTITQGYYGRMVEMAMAKNAEDAGQAKPFKSAHWQEPNILAHVRFNDRTDAEGKKVLFIEELQSDWGQEGKKKGFDTPRKTKPMSDEEYNAFMTNMKEAAAEELVRRGDGKLPLETARVIANSQPLIQVASWAGMENEYQETIVRREEDRADHQGSRTLPSAPFVTDTKAWLTLGIKRMIAYAAENGYDKVAFVNGEQSADRYDLSKQIKQVLVRPFGDQWNIKAYDNGDSARISETINDLSALDDYIGKDAADRARKQINESGSADLRGLDLKVGGEGMKAFYDKIVPQVANDVLKKLGGGKVEPVLVTEDGAVNVGMPNSVGEQSGFTITPAMREQVSRGLPLFSLARKVSDAVTSTIGKLDAAVDGLSNLPDQFAYLSDRYLALGKIARVDEISSEVRKAFDGAAPADKQAVYDYLTTRGATTGRISDHKLRSIAKRIKDTINYTGDQLVARGLLDQEARDHYRDQYLPRMYLRHMLDDQAFKVIGMGKKPSDMGYLKHRKDIPQEIRDVVLGEIKDPSFLSVNAIARAMRDVSLLDWMGKIAQNNEWVFPEIFVPWQGKKVTAYWLRAEADRIENQIPHYTPQNKAKAEALVAQMRSTAHQTLGSMSAIDHKKFKQIPDTRRYGLLRGMWVRNEIYNDIMGASQIVNADPTWFEDWFGFGGKGTRLTQWWKFTKVAANPPGQIRNFISNMVMLQLSGIGLHRLPFALIEAARDITSNGKYWQVAKKYGVTESTFTAQELFRVKRDLVEMEAQKGKLSSLRWLMSAGARFMEGVSDLYQFSEALGKTIKIMEEMKAGKSEAEAAIEAQKWLFDYSLVPQSVRIARNAPVGMPFLTYQIKVLPRLLEVAAKHPWRFLPWAGLLYGMQAAVASMFGVDDDELKKLKKSLPEWLQDRGHTVFLPFHDADGRLQVADVGYFFPWTFYSQIGKHASEGKIKKALVDDIGGQFSAPIVGAGAALMSNYDTFTKQPIYKETDPVGYQAAAIANYAYDLMAPPFISSHGVVSPMGLVDTKFGGKLTQALAGTTNRFGDPKATEEQALGAMLGFNFYGMDPEHTRVTNLKVMEYKIHEAEKSLKQRLMDKGLTQEQRTTAVRDYRERMNELQQEMVEYAKESQVPDQLKVRKQ